MDLARLDRIRRLIVIALFSDDELMEQIVFKGGNAVDLIHGAAMRGSIDLDFSLESDFAEQDPMAMKQRFESLLDTTLRAGGYRVFDVRFERRPPVVSPDLREFWGGYRLEFKVIDADAYRAVDESSRDMRVRAEPIGEGQRKTFQVDFSCHEYCRPKCEQVLDGYTIYVYTPEMIVCEKLRAICQQMPAYRELVRSPSASPRAKDFFDIYSLVSYFKFDLRSPENRETLECMFEAKRVPMTLLGQIGEHREYHRTAFPSVEQTVKPSVRLRAFDFYFDFVLDLVREL